MESIEKNHKYGITGPLSLKESTESEVRASEEMDRYIKECGFFEGDEEGQTRERVLGKLDFMVKEFVLRMSKADGQDRAYGGKIFTFGSYRLGVHDKGADIDALCIVPRHVTRKDFFSVFFEALRACPEVEGVTKVEEAFVPLMKFKFQGIPIDLVFARLNLPVVKDNINLLNDALLKNMDEKCVLSLNGSRTTDETLNLVPNVHSFHSALRCIKYWAKRRCVYGNPYGYFGGVAFSLCVARICQLYPNASSIVVVRKFFELYSSWKWPAPVMLRPVVDLNYNLKVWDPKVYPADKYHRMPVITPAYPSMCATHNVSNSTQHIMAKELTRAHEILSSYDGEDTLKRLFMLSDFFSRYKTFVQVLAISTSEEDLFPMWEGYVESRVRILASKLEAVEDVTYAVPFPKAFRLTGAQVNKLKPRTYGVKSCTSFFVAIDILASKTRQVFVEQPVREFLAFVGEHEKKTESMAVEVHSARRKEMMQFFRVYYERDEGNGTKQAKVED
jgi:poly(A) polymerase